MAASGPIEYADAAPEVRAVYDDIKRARRVEDVNNFWKYLARDPASHGLAPKLDAYLQQAPGVTLRGIRPLTLARQWRAAPTDTVELFLAAQHRGILAMSWDLLCPRCRPPSAPRAWRAGLRTNQPSR